MPNVRVSELTAATSPDGSELTPIVQAGVTKKMSLSQLESVLIAINRRGVINGVAALDADGDVVDAAGTKVSGEAAGHPGLAVHETLGLTAQTTLDMHTDDSALHSAAGDSSIGTSQIADGAVTTPKIADAAIIGQHISDASITAQKIGSAVGANSDALIYDSTELSGLTSRDFNLDYVRQDIVDAKGDLLVAAGLGDVVRKTVGADGTVLSADSSKADGFAYVNQNYRRLAPDLPASNTSSTYPEGGSQVYLSNGLAGGWPLQFGVVLTLKESDSRITQLFFDKFGNEAFVRGLTGTGVWSAFKSLTQPVARAVRTYRTSTVNLPNATSVIIGFPAESYDTTGMHTSTSDSRLTVPTGLGGIWHVSAQVQFYSSTLGRRFLSLTRSTEQIAQVGSSPTANTHAVQVSVDVVAEQGDYFQLYAFQDTGAALQVSAGESLTWFAAHFLGPLV